ncbi:RNA-binding protein [Halosegnis rubeus]|uniref:RNA-binding protein n=1 Tax=Halosegnis rubeus TaxID=2212850 RepID=A0A5N5U5D8_9EURY|nr:RNA-binding protein [Halosegnis rubeus]KAB7513755.1 RNA-binding protein [Halosegnis rubeus]KAB7514156.1 RNA-binding protein [Halosegnis rubeus]KAB7518994.1 RNA-binding protein [Halosegnis rubeus]
MASVPFHYVDLRAFCYVTEDRKRVADALGTFVPDGDDGEALELDYAETEGFNGDRILVVSIRLERADEMRHVLSKLTELDDIDTVIEELDHRVDEDCTFFLTLDKQAAFRGDVVQGDGITLRAKVEAYPAKKEHAVENVAETLASLRGD